MYIFKGLRPLPPAPLGIGDLVTTGLAGLVGLAGLAGLAGLGGKKNLVINLACKFDQFGWQK